MNQICNISTASREKGAALITALIFLVIMTLLALSAMNTTTLEEKMAANSQEINRAFQTAETGLELMIGDADVRRAALSTQYTRDEDGTGSANDYSGSTSNIGGYNASATYNSVFLQELPPSRSATPTEQSLAYYHFNLSSTGATISGAETTVNAGYAILRQASE